MATSTKNESSGFSAVGNRTSPAKQAIDSQDSHLSLLGHNTLANNGPPPLKKIWVGNATSHPLVNAPQSNLGNQVSFEVPEGQESDDGNIHINSLVARVDTPDKGPSNIPVVDLADCSDDETYAEAIEKDDDDDGSGEYSISPSGDAVNTSSMTIPLPNLAPDELNLFGWFDNKTASRVKNR
ncbi:hypothetical protein GRF29_1g1099375 [Pseudopithomyces chartarum]|uniref:Uncharacterized protein n=1 Tax=Pseudopithomyces chartarum TaxID=1892770 RepID=A0AAN6M6R6_9PLEO|nr:hypothetical protein GRF29_1g1099375 [Pseudopithomyces chartarum]